MAETALLQQVAGFVVAMWWTSKWLIQRPPARWRFAVAGLSGSLLWLFVAYTATRAEAVSGEGVVTAFNSLPLAYFAAFMAFASAVGIVLGLLLWTEEEMQDAAAGAPEYLKSGVSRED